MGELLVGGSDIARGCWNNHGKSTGSFLVDLPWKRDLACSYITEELGRYCTNGTIEVHGREDRQMKLRGQRVQLPEVKYRLRQCLSHGIDLAVDVVRYEEVQHSCLHSLLFSESDC